MKTKHIRVLAILAVGLFIAGKAPGADEPITKEKLVRRTQELFGADGKVNALLDRRNNEDVVWERIGE